MNTIIKAENITKIYTRGSEDVHALKGVSLEIAEGEFAAFIGPSGSGKTTLVNILGCLDNPTSGTLAVGGKTVFSEHETLSETRLTHIRRQYFGYIFQSFYLLPALTVYENTILPFTFYKNSSAKDDAAGVLEMLGLKDRMKHLPSQLSGGEMQRVALARALVNNPKVLLADEPTGNLDAKRSAEIGALLRDLNKKNGLTIVMVTHNVELAKSAHRVIELKDGMLIG
jgi:putative ABC transport system ATP-binding protein